MKLIHALTAGLAGAVVLTVAHQLLRKVSDDAPRMDLMGEEALDKITDKTGTDIPEENKYAVTMVGDIASNTLYYALAALGKNKPSVIPGGLLGLAAGVGGVYLPKHLGLSNKYSDRTLKTRIMTMAIYTLGGFVSAKVAAMLSKKQHR